MSRHYVVRYCTEETCISTDLSTGSFIIVVTRERSLTPPLNIRKDIKRFDDFERCYQHE